MWKFSDQPPMPYSKIGKKEQPCRCYYLAHIDKFPDGFGNQFTKIKISGGKKIKVKSDNWEENLNGISMMLIREAFTTREIAQRFGCPEEFVEIVRDSLKRTNVHHYGKVGSLYDLWHTNYIESQEAFDTILKNSAGKDAFVGPSDVNERPDTGAVKQTTLAFLKGWA